MQIRNMAELQRCLEHVKVNIESLIVSQGAELNLMIHSRYELEFILNVISWDHYRVNEAEEIFFLIEINGRQEPICFVKDEEFNRWYAYQCTHECVELSEEDLPDYVAITYLEEEIFYAATLVKRMYRDGILHKISCYSIKIFLDEPFRIVQILSEEECLDWILHFEKENNITDVKLLKF